MTMLGLLINNRRIGTILLPVVYPHPNPMFLRGKGAIFFVDHGESSPIGVWTIGPSVAPGMKAVRYYFAFNWLAHLIDAWNQSWAPANNTGLLFIESK
jgi:hypothetical protein